MIDMREALKERLHETDCDLCKVFNFPFILAFCKSHPDHPLIVSTEHKKEFTEEEKKMIQDIFKGREVVFTMKSIPDHAHAHVRP
jgi:hypothetical protein